MITSILHVFSNTFKVILFRKTIHWKIVLWLGVSSVILSFAGAYANSFVNLDIIKIFLGFFLVAISILFFYRSSLKVLPTLKNSTAIVGVAGFMAGFIGTGGAIRGLALTSFNLEKNFYVGTSSAIDFGVDAGRAFVYWHNNYFSEEIILFIPLMASAALFGSYLGKKILNRISQETFRKIVLLLVFSTGLLMILQHLMKELN